MKTADKGYIPASSRRKFLRLAGLTILSGSALHSCQNAGSRNNPADSIPSSPSPAAMPEIAVQLYTVRDQISQDLPGTLKRIAEIGYKYVETAFWPEGVTHQMAAKHLKDAGLIPIASHVEIPAGEHRKTFLDIAGAYGVKNLIWHGWPEDTRYSSKEGTRELIRVYNDASEFAADNGLNFGLHNHWWEFRNIAGGKPVFEYWLEELHPAIFFELDTYWIKVAGHNPADIIKRFGSRARLLHIKDGPARWHAELATDNPDPMTAVGKGTQDMPSILAAAQQHVNWLVVEMDKTEGDVFQQLTESLNYLKSHSERPL